jgi:hypothetical protein
MQLSLGDNVDQKAEITKPEVETLKVAKKAKTRRVSKPTKKMAKRNKEAASGGAAKYPRHTVEKALRIPKAIIEQNAGKECTDKESATYVGVGFNGPYRVEISSSLKYGFLSRPHAGSIAVTERARQAIRPQKPGDEIEALRQAVLDAPDISYFRGLQTLPWRIFARRKFF